MSPRATCSWILLNLLAVSGCGTSRAVWTDGGRDGAVPPHAPVSPDAPLPWDAPPPSDASSMCPPDWVICDGGACVDTNTDSRNCGGCGNVCNTSNGFNCVAGRCTCHCDPLTCCGPIQCVDTRSDDTNCGKCGVTCTGGTTCQWGVCWCPPTLPTECSGTCVDTNSNNSHCGACDNVCATGQSCANGVCV